MFSYSLDSDLQPEEAIFWSREALSAVAPGILTPFSFSVLAEVMRRSWYNYYGRLGFEAYPGRRLLRQHNGRAYLNLSLSAQLEAEEASVEPLTLWLNGQARQIVAWQKPGILSALKSGRKQKRIEALLADLAKEFTTIDSRARAWYAKTQEIRWTQAEILQVMEEIERVGADSLMLFFAARHNLMLLYNRLFQLVAKSAPNSTAWPQTVALLSQPTPLRELEITNQIEDLAARLRQLWAEAPSVADSFPPAQAAEWREALPDGELKSDLAYFFEQYGHRGSLEGELAHPRWQESPTPVLQAIQLCAQKQLESSSHLEEGANSANGLPGIDQKQLMQWRRQAASLHELQSRSLGAFSYIQAGTRSWALAAAKEAMNDGRLTAIEQVFLFELEEIKEMMTGEWNISSRDEIHSTAAERSELLEQWRQSAAAPLLIGDAPATGQLSDAPLPAHARVVEIGALRDELPRGALLSAEKDSAPLLLSMTQLGAGDALLFPLAHGFVVDVEPALDPIGAAAHLSTKRIYYRYV